MKSRILSQIPSKIWKSINESTEEIFQDVVLLFVITKSANDPYILRSWILKKNKTGRYHSHNSNAINLSDKEISDMGRYF